MYVITGPTATGKTAYALELAKKHNGELVNCDSRQIYKGLDIVTGKDLDLTTGEYTLSEKYKDFSIGYYTLPINQSSHATDHSLPTTHNSPLTTNHLSHTTKLWLYDIVSPALPFSAFDYKKLATQVIVDIRKRGKTPIIVGGSYFYIKTLLYKTVEKKAEADPALRENMNTKSVLELQDILKNLSYDFFDSLNNSEKNNPHRLARNIEILKMNPEYRLSNETYTWDTEWTHTNIQMCAFEKPESEEYREQISQRVAKRLKDGACEETATLLDTYGADAPGLTSIGYTQLIAYLNNTKHYEDAIDEWIIREVQYAKRQMTFMKKDPHIEWMAEAK